MERSEAQCKSVCRVTLKTGVMSASDKFNYNVVY